MLFRCGPIPLASISKSVREGPFPMISEVIIEMTRETLQFVPGSNPHTFTLYLYLKLHILHLPFVLPFFLYIYLYLSLLPSAFTLTFYFYLLLLPFTFNFYHLPLSFTFTFTFISRWQSYWGVGVHVVRGRPGTEQHRSEITRVQVHQNHTKELHQSIHKRWVWEK